MNFALESTGTADLLLPLNSIEHLRQMRTRFNHLYRFSFDVSIGVALRIRQQVNVYGPKAMMCIKRRITKAYSIVDFIGSMDRISGPSLGPTVVIPWCVPIAWVATRPSCVHSCRQETGQLLKIAAC